MTAPPVWGRKSAYGYTVLAAWENAEKAEEIVLIFEKDLPPCIPIAQLNLHSSFFWGPSKRHTFLLWQVERLSQLRLDVWCDMSMKRSARKSRKCAEPQARTGDWKNKTVKICSCRSCFLPTVLMLCLANRFRSEGSSFLTVVISQGKGSDMEPNSHTTRMRMFCLAPTQPILERCT